MSMEVTTGFQLAGIVLAYLLVTVLLPHLVLGKSIKFRDRYERFMIYLVCGNFYVINLVFLLELMHISHPVTLILFTILPLGFVKIKLEDIPAGKILSEKWETVRRIAAGEMGIKAFFRSGKKTRKNRRINIGKHLKNVYLKHLPEVLLILFVIVSTFVLFGISEFKEFGFKASDLVVHNHWINSLCENNIFVDGVYPHGFHNMLYFLHAVFGFDTFVLLRVMAVLNTLMVFLMLLCFLKLICKSKYLAFAGTVFYILTNFARPNTYYRFYATLPQEYGMIFILPAVYCGFMYFKEQRRELRESASNNAKYYLAGFAASFSLTLAVHFYDTMVLGLFAIAMAIGFIVWFVRKIYFKRVVITCFIGLMIAILPMLIAFIFGTPLQGSLGWGLSIITGEEYETESTDSDDGTFGGFSPHRQGSDFDDMNKDQSLDTELTEEDNLSMVERIKKSPEYIQGVLQGFVFETPYGTFWWLVPLMIGISMATGILYMIFSKDKTYGAAVFTTGLYMLFMTVLICASEFKLPALMDKARTSIYYAYSLPILFVLPMDLVISLPEIKSRKRIFSDLVSFTVLSGVVAYLFITGNIKKEYSMEGLETNEAVTCLTNIIREEKDDTWTIISCNDEGRMAYGHGFHYESYVFLRDMEGLGSAARVRIPTETVFFFIEKKPIDYSITYEGSGQYVSKDGASMPIPTSAGLAVYMGEDRWVVMSKMYYWAETFRSLYPNEMTVYFENDDFVCYRCDQNPYRLFNFAIDYDFNTRGWGQN